MPLVCDLFVSSGEFWNLPFILGVLHFREMGLGPSLFIHCAGPALCPVSLGMYLLLFKGTLVLLL